MTINKNLRALIFCIGFVVITCTIDLIVRTWFPAFKEFEYSSLIEGVISVLICTQLERVLYEFDPSHNGNVRLKIKKK